MTERSVLSVSQLSQQMAAVMEERFPAVWVEGEISNFKVYSSGHAYFTLKDEAAQLRCVLFRTRARRADVLCVAAGRVNVVTADMVKPGAWVIDVGNTQLPSGKWVGDVDFEGVSKVAHITPVPGGVGPMTRAMLLRNTLLAAERQLGSAR